MITIKINDKEKSIDILGVVKCEDLYKKIELLEDQLYLDTGGSYTSIDKDNYIIITGGETFVTGEKRKANNVKDQTIFLNDKSITLPSNKVKCEEIKKYDERIKDNCKVFYETLPQLPDEAIEDNCTLIITSQNCKFISISMTNDNIIDVEECTYYDRKPPKKQKKYRIRIDGKKYDVEKSHLKGEGILALAGKNWQEFDLQQKFKGGKREIINHDQEVDFFIKGVERFETVPRQAQQG